MVARRKPSFTDLAIIVLEKSHRPMTCPEMIRAAKREGILDSEGLTPDKTLYAALTRSILNDPSSPFRRVGRGLFDLKGTIYDKHLAELVRRLPTRT